MPLHSDRVAELKTFVHLLKSDPKILSDPQLGFFRDYIKELGGRVPECDDTDPTSTQDKAKEKEPNFEESSESEESVSEPSAAEDVSEEDVEEEEEEEDSELLKPETEEAPPLGSDSIKEDDEIDQDKVASLKESAAEALQSNDYETGLTKYNEVIQMVHPTAMIYTRRADILMKLKRPIACIRDCTEALKLNPDNAKAYRLRGKAERYLGNWENSHNDISIGQKIDFDESIEEMEKFVAGKWKKIETKNRSKALKKEAKDKQQREKRREKARKACEKQKNKDKKEASKSANMGGMPGGMGGMGGMPGGMGGMPGGMGGMPGGMGGMSGGMGGMPGGMGGMPGGMGGMPGGMGGMPGGMGGMPGGMGGMGGGMPGAGAGGMGGLLGGLMNDPDLQKVFENPKVMGAMQDLMTNPGNIAKYQNDPEVMEAFSKLTTKFGQGGAGGAAP